MLDPSTGPDPDPAFPPASPPGRALVVALTCPALGQLGREAGFPVAVLSATADVARLASRLTAVSYGARSPRAYDDWPLPFDEGLLYGEDLRYRHLAFDPRWMGAAALPDGVAIEAGCLEVALPKGASVADLGAVLRAGLADLSLDRVARRPDRVRRRYFTGRPVVIAPRYALLVPGDIERVRVADDLHRFGPGDLAGVAAAVALAVDSLAMAGIATGRRPCGGTRHA